MTGCARGFNKFSSTFEAMAPPVYAQIATVMTNIASPKAAT